MKFTDPSIQTVAFSDLRTMIRRGQIFSFHYEYDAYSGVPNHGLFAEVIRPNGEFDRILVGKRTPKKPELMDCLLDALRQENPADSLHLTGDGFPLKALCGVGRFAKLCGIDQTKELDDFLAADNRCLKCWISWRVKNNSA